MTKFVLGLLMLAIPAAFLGAASSDALPRRLSEPRRQVTNIGAFHSAAVAHAASHPRTAQPSDPAASAGQAPLALLKLLVASTIVLDAVASDGECTLAPAAKRHCNIYSPLAAH
jgi:hypothetical protein